MRCINALDVIFRESGNDTLGQGELGLDDPLFVRSRLSMASSRRGWSVAVPATRVKRRTAHMSHLAVRHGGRYSILQASSYVDASTSSSVACAASALSPHHSVCRSNKTAENGGAPPAGTAVLSPARKHLCPPFPLVGNLGS